MYICPLCNALEIIEKRCVKCGTLLQDAGRIMDYYDDYSPYVQIEGMKKINGIADDYANHLCPHLFYCQHCNSEQYVLVNEINH